MSDDRTNLFTAYIGRNEYRERIFVQVDTRQDPRSARMTTEHTPVPEGNVDLSVTYWTLRYRSNRGASFGNGSGLARFQTRAMTEVAPGWTTADVRSLAAIAEKWHLNDMRGACAHMGEDAQAGTYNHETRQTEGATACPETGYRNGSAWLTEVIPADVWAEIRRLSELPRGTVQHPID